MSLHKNNPEIFSFYDIACAVLVLLPIILTGIVLAVGLSLLVHPVSTSLQCQNATGNITINLFSNSTTTLGWNWQDPGNITQIAEDGLFVTNFDNSSDYFIGTGYLPETWHKLKIYNSTDYGQLNCTTDAVPVTPTPIPIMPSTESNINPVSIFSYWWVGAGALGIILLFRKW